MLPKSAFVTKFACANNLAAKSSAVSLLNSSLLNFYHDYDQQFCFQFH